MKKYIDLEDMVNVNCSNVLDIIQKNGVVSRKAITDISGLSWGGMTKIVNKLLENGYITEKKQKNTSSSGRTPGVLTVNTEKNFVAGLDINKTGLKAVVTDLTGKILKSYSAPVYTAEKESFLEEITDFIGKVFSDFEKGLIISMGVAMQGIVDSRRGISVKFPDAEGWENVPVKKLLEEKFGVSVFIEHDPDCLLYSQLGYGAKENAVLLRIDKSIGMAAAIGGRIIKGEGIFEIAHNVVMPGGAKCSCGMHGCMEAYIRPCMDGDKINTGAVGELMLPLAATVKNMCGIFNADRVILTGALMEHEELFCNDLHDALASLDCNVKIEFLPLADFAVKGAALIAVNKSINSLLI
ncbi:MAG: ROK family transcriptional regulator [Clostridia bacterium]|nr:ROK family transcriptional regulator [Clostridia bacterium]